MTNVRLVTPWVAAAALLVGIGSDPGAEDRVSVSDDPVTRIESALLVSPQDKMGDAPEAPGLPRGDAGPVGPGVLAAVAGLVVRRGSVNRLESSPSRGPPGRGEITYRSFNRSVPQPQHSARPARWSSGRGLSTRSARVTTRTQENTP